MARAFHGCTVSHDAFPVIGCIGFGTRAAMPNVQPSAARLKSGEVIRFDVGGRYKHYRADIARMAVLGEADDKTSTYVDALHVGVLKALEMIRPGVKASAVFETAVEAVRREGIPHYCRSHVGHGIGVDGYDLPDLTAASKDVIEEGMVMCVETPYYELGWAGLQVEDMIVVRGDGIEFADDQRRRPEGDAMTVAELPRALLREDLANASGKEVRAAARSGQWRRATHGLARGYVQANMAIVPQRYAFDFMLLLPAQPETLSGDRRHRSRRSRAAVCCARQRRAGRPSGISGVSRR